MKMIIREISETENKDYWIGEIGKAKWIAGKYLCELLSTSDFYKLCGKSSKVFLLTDENNLVSFCTFAETDDIDDTELTPWIGFVFTFPQYRGKRNIEKLFNHIYPIAKSQGIKTIYISTDQKGLYENFGYTFYTTLKDRNGDMSLVYKRDIVLEHC